MMQGKCISTPYIRCSKGWGFVKGVYACILFFFIYDRDIYKIFFIIIAHAKVSKSRNYLFTKYRENRSL